MVDPFSATSGEDPRRDPLRSLDAFLEQLRSQIATLAGARNRSDIDACDVDQIGHILCLIANESHRQTREIVHIREIAEAFLALYKAVHPAQALQYEQLEKMRAELARCCPPDDHPEPICCYVPCLRDGEFTRGDGYSVKSTGYIRPAQVSEGPHEQWTIEPHLMHENEELPSVPQGPIVGQLIPSVQTPRVLDFRSGPAPSGSQAPVTFRTFTNTGVSTSIWPPDMSGARGGDVVLMSGNLWLKLSVDGGKTFTDLDFTKIFAADTTYGGWAGDQVIHYVPAIDCFVLYVQSSAGTGANVSKNVVKVALASPSDLKKHKGGKPAWWRQWDFTSDDFGMNFWMDFPDLTYGDAFLYVNTNTFARSFDASGNEKQDFRGKLFFELPLKELAAGSGFSYQYALVTDALVYGSPTQNIADENYWAAHVNNSTMRIYSSKGADPNYYWRERKLGANWPRGTKDDIVSAAPDSPDWISEDYRIIGATRVGTQLWFAWSAASGDGGAGGFKFPQPHIQIAKFDVAQDYKFLEQTQVWNADISFAYPSLTTNSDNEVGISLAWGGGKSYGSHAVGILGDFVVWYGDPSDQTSTRLNPTRFGDYLHVRLAHPDTRFYGAFGYAVNTDTSVTPSAERDDYYYVEFGREKLAPPPLH